MAKENKTETLRQMSEQELNDKLVTARKALFDLKIKRAEQKNPLKIRWSRREVARIKTLINEKKAKTDAAASKKEQKIA